MTLKRFRIRKIDISLDQTLKDLQEQMNHAMGGGISFMQAQRELAYRVKQLGLNNYPMRGKKGNEPLQL